MILESFDAWVRPESAGQLAQIRAQRLGAYITFEGADGCGKSTFAKSLLQNLLEQNLSSILTREPGGTNFGLKLRQILQYRDQIGEIDAKAEYLLFAADRAQHFAQVVIPNLQAGRIVISDRTGDSSIVYQGYGRGLDCTMINQINQWATSKIKPNLIIYLKIDLQTSQARIAGRAEQMTAFEQADVLFLNKLISGFDDLYANRADVLILDGKLPTSDLVTQATVRILDLVKLER